MPLDPADHRQYLIDQIAKCLRLAEVIGDSRTSDILRAMALEYQVKLDHQQDIERQPPH